MNTYAETTACDQQAPVGLGGGIIRPAEPRQLPQSLTIHPVLNGYWAQVGCQTVVFETKEKLLLELGRYLTDWRAVQKEYLEKQAK